MKEGWEIKKLGEVVDKSNGLWKGKKPPYINVAVIRNTNFSKDCKLSLDNVEFLDVEQKQFSTRKLQYGDIIIEKSGGSDKQPVGRPILFTLKEGNYSFSNFTSSLRIKEGISVSPKYLQLNLYHQYLEGATRALQSATTGIHNLDFKGYLELPVPVPPMDEQLRIVKILDDAFAKIDKLKANAQKNLANAKALFQATLKKELTPKPDWQTSSFKDICSVINGRAYSKEELLLKGKYRVLRVGNFFTNDNWYYSDLELDDDKYCSNGDLLYAWSASFGPKIWDGEKVIYHYHIWKLVPKNMDRDFVYFWLSSSFLLSQVMTKLHGTTMVHITKGMMENSKIKYPSLEEQKIISQKIKLLQNKEILIVAHCEKTIAECDALKQSILRKAFNGEL